MDQDEAVRGLVHLKVSYLYGLLLPRVVPEGRWSDVLGMAMNLEYVGGGARTIDVDEIAQSMLDPDQAAFMEERIFQPLLKRAAVVGGFEIAKLYGEGHGHIENWRSEPWYIYARLMRNTTSHGTLGVLNRGRPTWKSEASRRSNGPGAN